MKTVCVVDDQPIVHKAMQTVFEEVAHLNLIGSFNNAEQFIEEFEILRPDVTIMDLDLPGMSGIEAISAIKINFPSANFLVVSNYDDDERLFKSLEAGAVGYLLKRVFFDDIPQAIDLIFQGGVPMTPEIARKVIVYFHKRSGIVLEGLQKLTQREKLVLELLSDGLLYKEIAEKLLVGIDAIKKHTQHIYGKLHVQTRSEAIRMYLTR